MDATRIRFAHVAFKTYQYTFFSRQAEGEAIIRFYTYV